MNRDFITVLYKTVVPSMISRFTLDDRVDAIEIISDLDFSSVSKFSEKCIFQQKDIGIDLDKNEVTKTLLNVINYKTENVIQVNPLFPFISIESLVSADNFLQSERYNTVIGSYIDSCFNKSNNFSDNDLGIFTAFKISCFNHTCNRISAPLKLICLKAIEMVSLRTSKDYKLFELIINSGFEI